MDKLRNGEIDLICTAHYTEERAKQFLYSDLPLGYETSILYAKADSSISYQDFDAMQNRKIGLLNESYSAQDFEKYAQREEIQFEGIYYERENDMRAALDSGAIDMMVVGSRYATSDLKLVDTSGANAFYCISQMDNIALIDEIEVAIQQIMFDEPDFEGTLRKKYFGHDAITSSPLYTKEELEYIQSLGTVKVKLMQNQMPSCYVENGETKGIWADVIKLVARKTGINIVLEGGDKESYSQEAYEQYIANGYLLLRTQKAMEYMSNIEGTIASNAITNVSVAYIKRQASFVEDKYVSQVIALTKDLAYLEPMLI